MAYDYEKSEYVNMYVDSMTDRILKIHPTWNEEKVRNNVFKKFKEQSQNPVVIMDNNYTHESQDATMLSVIDWAIAREPIIAGNATFYKTHHEAINPIASMLDGMLKRRKAFKKQMFTIENASSQEYKDLDLKQANEKVSVNAYYGASGMPAAAFYSTWSGPATTSTAQSVISTTETTFESFIGDNYIFLDLDECFFWIEQALKDEDFTMDKWVKKKSPYEVFERLRTKFYKWKPNYEEPLLRYLKNSSSEVLTRIYYKNNLTGFIEDHNFMIELYQKIFEDIPNYETVDVKDPDWEKNIPRQFRGEYSSPKDWNKHVFKEMFCDPNELPSKVKDTVKEFSDLLVKYVYCQYLSFDRIHRLKNFYRNTVTVIDTDSNILSLDRWVYFTRDKIMTSDYGRSEESNDYITINVITYVITQVVQDILLYYGKCSNIPEEFRSRFNMKNEFFFAKLVIASVKKRYLSLIKLREGNLLNPAKTDVKGFDFKKATTSDKVSKFFEQLVEDEVLTPKVINTKQLQTILENFKKDIYEAIRNGDTSYLPLGSIKDIAAYKDPASEQSVRGYLAWNMLYPDKQIEAPAKVSLLKLNLFTEDRLNIIEQSDPEIYSILKDKIFHDRTGFFISRKKDGTLNVRGLQVIAIPSGEKIPKWLLPYIDYTNMINSIVAPFNSVLDLLHIQMAQEGKSYKGINRKSDGMTNIIKF